MNVVRIQKVVALVFRSNYFLLSNGSQEGKNRVFKKEYLDRRPNASISFVRSDLSDHLHTTFKGFPS